MSAGFTRILNFRANNLGSNATLLLTFDDENTIGGIFNVVFPIAFKVASFGANGVYQFQLRYDQQLGFTSAQIHGDSVVANTFVRLDPGEETTLKDDNHFSTPQSIDPPTSAIKAANDTAARQNFGVGVFDSHDRPSQALVYPDVSPRSSVIVEFIPVLKGYITSDYREGDILRGPVASPVIFKENLVNLEQNTNWIVTFDPATGQFQILRE